MRGSKSEVNKSEEVRKLLLANPKISAKEVSATLAERGISVANGLFYFVKGKMKGRKSRHTRAKRMVEQVSAATASGNGDAVKIILRVKTWATEVGGIKKLKALVDALSE